MSARGRPWPRGRPQGHIFKSLVLASKLKSLVLASNPTSPRKCPALGSRAALFFDWLKRKITKHENLLNSSIGVARIFYWGGNQPANDMKYDDIINFQKEGFFIGKNTLEWKVRSLGLRLVRKQDVVEVNQKLMFSKYLLNVEALWRKQCNSNVSQTEIWGRGTQPPETLAMGWVIVWKFL